ncbi:hypothetical protein FOL47_001512 [Perkinsus chesapeaki]|uniref:Uncharacterized protein n=1 Tax=Perkinsus chesapeaki TaxID=330153 RepID=A0A7J6KRP2_PERCH|nr:hypothetical protein FOL47_001512 [Perkinsus chesapeaki]
MSCFDNIKDKSLKAPAVPPLETLIGNAPYFANMTYDLHPDDELLKSIFSNENPDDKSKCRAALTMSIEKFVHKDAKYFLSNLIKALLREEYRVNPGPLMAHIFHCCSATECRGFSGKPAGVPGAYYYHCGLLEVIRDSLRQGKSLPSVLTKLSKYHESIACRASERARADREDNAHKSKGKGKGKDSDKKKGKGRGKGRRDGDDNPRKTIVESTKALSPKRRRVNDN